MKELLGDFVECMTTYDREKHNHVGVCPWCLEEFVLGDDDLAHYVACANSHFEPPNSDIVDVSHTCSKCKGKLRSRHHRSSFHSSDPSIAFAPFALYKDFKQ